MAGQGDDRRIEQRGAASSGRARDAAPRRSWQERAFYLSYWSEKGDEKEVLLGGLMRFLAPQKYFVIPDQGWDDWDLKIARGLWSRALVLVCTENHGGIEAAAARALRHAALAALGLRAARLCGGDGGAR